MSKLLVSQDSAINQLKMVVVGNMGVGKSSLVVRFSEDKFHESYISTIGVDFRFRILRVDDIIVKLQIWDTAGQERFRSVTSSYYRAAEGLIVAFDCTNRESFEALNKWFDELQLTIGTSVPYVLVGCKCDNVENREITADEAIEFAKTYKTEYFETSAKTADTEKPFIYLAKQIIERKKTMNSANSVEANVSKKVSLWSTARDSIQNCC